MTMETLRRRRRRRSRVDSNRSNNNDDVVEATPTTFVSEAGLSSHEIREQQHLRNDNYNAQPSRRRRQRRRSSAKKLGSLLLKKLNWGKKGVKKKSCILDDNDDDDDYDCVPDMKPGSEEESSNISPLLGREIKFQDVNHNDDDDACNESSLVVDDDGNGNDDDVSDYDAYSTGSQQSLISDDDDGEPIPSHLRGIERLEKKHQKRDERLQRLLLKKQQPQQPQRRSNKSFEMSMLRNETAIREWQRNSFLMNDGGIERGGGGGGGGRRQVRLGLSPLDQIKHGLLFESQVNANGLYSVLSYILATSAFYYIVDSVFTGLKYLLRESVSADTFYLVTFILGVAVMRINGYLWKWLDEDSWEIMKLEMDNRDRLGYVDAKIFRWLKSNTRLKSFSNIICYNMVYIGLCHFYYIGLNQLAYAPATTWYNDVKLEATATAESMIPPASTATCEAYRDLVQGRLRGMFAYYLCADPNWSIIQTVYHTGMFVLAASIYAMMGSSFITAYD